MGNTHNYTFFMGGADYSNGYDRIFESTTGLIKYADENGVEIPPLLRLRARRLGAVKAAGDVTAITQRYHDAITQLLIVYFEGDGSITAPKNTFRREMVQALGDAFDLGWTDGGQEGVPQGAALDWFNAKIEAEFAHIDGVFVQAKELKAEEDADWFSWATARADGYTGAVLAFYNAGKLYAAKGKLLTWNLGQTETHCPTCASLSGQRHRASWYLARNYIPREPGAAMVCGGYRCDCFLTDGNGKEVTL